MARGSITPMKPFCRAMDKWQTIIGIRAGLYPLWLIGANLVARTGGLAILVLIGHSYSQAELGTYFKLLALIGLAVTATQAGSGPLLIRLTQNDALRSAMLIVGIRVLIALIASGFVVSATSLPFAKFWPLLLIPIAAALSPDWLITAHNRFSRISIIAVIGQGAGITIAVCASLTHSQLGLYFIAPAISLSSLLLAAFFAYRSSQPRLIGPSSLGQTSAFGLVGFTLLAGFLPNIDFVLLDIADDALFLAQRVFLFCAGLNTAIASTLFAKQQSGKLRDIWLLAPMGLVSGLLLLWPDGLAHLVYEAPSIHLINILQIGAAWPLLLAVLTRQLLIMQEAPDARWVGWLCLAMVLSSAFVLPDAITPSNTMVLITLRLAVLSVILLACQKVLTKRQVMA